MSDNSNSSDAPVKGLTIREAARSLDISEQYVRQLVFGDKLHAEKIEGRWLIDPEAVEDYKNSHDDNKAISYIVSLTPGDLAAIQAAFPHLEFTKRFDAQKAREYRARRDAKAGK